MQNCKVLNCKTCKLSRF